MRKYLKEMVTIYTLTGGLNLMFNRAFKKDSNVLQDEWRKAREEIAAVLFVN